MGPELKRRRRECRLSGWLVCQRSGIGRSRLSDIERAHVTPTAEEIQRIETAIEQLSLARARVIEVAAQVGWPQSAI